MKIDHDPNALTITITDLDRALWLDGSKLYYAMPRDYRPDINPAELDDVYQTYYALEHLTGRKTPKVVNDALDNLQELAKIYAAYAYHTLGLICKVDTPKEPHL